MRRRPSIPAPLPFAAILASVLGAGCATGRGPYQSMKEGQRQPQRAAELAIEAADLMQCDPAEAERRLREALRLDLYCGPAHNNLGVLHLSAGDLYEAASEFEWARKLMPGNPILRMNLAFTLERAGRVDEAIQTYATALEVAPDHVPTLAALCRIQLRCNRTDAKTRTMLAEVALRGETPEWRSWAQQQLTKLREGT